MTDREVQVLKVARADSRDPLAVIFDYPTHSTSLGPGNYLVSGDIHGLAAQFLEKYLGGDVVTPEFAGASGNIDPGCVCCPTSGPPTAGFRSQF